MRALLWTRRTTLLVGYLATSLWAFSELVVFSSGDPAWPGLAAGGLWIVGLVAAVAGEFVGSLTLYLLSAVVVVLTAGVAVFFMVAWATSS